MPKPKTKIAKTKKAVEAESPEAEGVLAKTVSAAPTEGPEAPETLAPTLELMGSRQFTSWMAAEGVSLAFTTYQTGKLFLIGLGPDGRLSVFERTFNRCMGLCAEGGGLHMSTLYQLWRFENTLAPGQLHDGYDRLYLPIDAHTTGDLDIHDVAVAGDGRVIFVNTLFSCLATIEPSSSFQPL